MRPTIERFLAMTIFAGLLMASLPVSFNHDLGEVRMQTPHQNQLVVRNEAAIKAVARLGEPGQSTKSLLVSVGDGSERIFKTLQTNPQNVTRVTRLAGMPSGLWCQLFPSWPRCHILIATAATKEGVKPNENLAQNRIGGSFAFGWAADASTGDRPEG